LKIPLIEELGSFIYSRPPSIDNTKPTPDALVPMAHFPVDQGERAVHDTFQRPYWL